MYLCIFLYKLTLERFCCSIHVDKYFLFRTENGNIYVLHYCHISGRTSLFNLSKGPSDEWFRKLISDYPQLAFRKPQSRDRGRSSMSNNTVADTFITFWTDMLKKHNVIDKPSQVIKKRIKKVIYNKYNSIIEIFIRISSAEIKAIR